MFGTKKPTPPPLRNLKEGVAPQPTVYIPSLEEVDGKKGGGKINLILAFKDNAPSNITALNDEKGKLMERIREIDKEAGTLAAMLTTIHEVETKYANQH